MLLFCILSFHFDVGGTWLVAAHHHPVAEKVQRWAWGRTRCPWPHHSVHLLSPVSAHLQELDGLELSEWMGSDSIKAWAEPVKLHSPSCQQENPTRREGGKEREREGERDRDKGKVLSEATQLSLIIAVHQPTASHYHGPCQLSALQTLRGKKPLAWQ